jgi:ABC-type multidrug transport system fused ATPase/permease subunit
MIYTNVYSQVDNASEVREIKIEEIKQILDLVAKVLNDQIKKLLYNGGFSFICNFISIFFWSLVGNRCIYKLKEKYFTIILKQEQSWFDSNNPLEISTNVNAQLEDIEQGIGERAGALLTILSQCIAGFVFAFLSSWKLTLVMCSVMPVAIILANIFMASMTKGTILSKKIWGEAGGIIEEILYNIKTVASFSNFEFEIKKFYEKVEEVWKIDLSNAYKLGGAMGSVTFLLNGWKSIFEIILAVFKCLEKKLLSLNEEDILSFLGNNMWKNEIFYDDNFEEFLEIKKKVENK